MRRMPINKRIHRQNTTHINYVFLKIKNQLHIITGDYGFWFKYVFDTLRKTINIHSGIAKKLSFLKFDTATSPSSNNSLLGFAMDKPTNISQSSMSIDVYPVF